jgi:hypothetical protein
VRLSVFDATLPPIVTIESGDLVSFPNIWSHFHERIAARGADQPLGGIAHEQSRARAALDRRPDRGQGRRIGRRRRDPLLPAAAPVT